MANDRVVTGNWYNANNPYVRPDMVKHWVLVLAYRSDMSADRLAGLAKAVEYGRSKGIEVFLNPIAG